MNKYAIAQIHLLKQSVSGVVKQSSKVASMIGIEQELVEDSQQTAIALLYMTYALETAMALRDLSAK